MNVIHFNEKACEKIQRYFDSYLDNELLAETNLEVLRHLASCHDCTHLLESRGHLKKSVKQAVIQEEAPVAVLESIQKRIREGERRRFLAGDLGRWAMAAAAGLILAISGVILFRPDSLFTPVATNGRGVLQVNSAQAREILRVGLIDHVHCTLQSGTWKQVVSFEHMQQATGRAALGPEFIGLVPMVKEKLGPDFQIVQGHRCTTNNREYVHLIATGENGAILSLVITEKKDETFTRAEVAATLEASGVPLYRDHQDQFEIAGFETNRFLAYVVSNLESNANLTVASTLAPSVYEYLRRLEV